MKQKYKQFKTKRSSRIISYNLKTKIKALILVYKIYGTPVKVVSQKTFYEIFKEPKLSKYIIIFIR